MLAYLIAEPEPVGESPVDAAAAGRPPERTPAAQLAYEAAQRLDDDWWLPRRRQSSNQAPVVA